MAARSFQVTLAATANTPIAVPAGFPPLARHVVFQNNAASAMRIGDSNVSSTKGYQLAASGAANSSLRLGPLEDPIDLSTFCVAGTATQVLDVVYID